MSFPRGARRDLDFHSWEWLADRLIQSIARPHESRASGRFREAISIQDREAKTVKIARD